MKHRDGPEPLRRECPLSLAAAEHRPRRPVAVAVAAEAFDSMMVQCQIPASMFEDVTEA